MTEWLLLLAAILLTGGTAVFVAAEFSLVALDRPTVQKAIDAGDGRARVVLQSLTQLSTQLSAAQVGITITTLVVGYLAQPSIGRLLAGPLGSLGLGAASGRGHLRRPRPRAGDRLLDGLRRAAPTVPRHLGAPDDGEGRRAARPHLRDGGQAAHPRAQRLGQRVPARDRDRAAGELSGARTPQELASLVQRSAEAGTLEVTTARLLTKTLGLRRAHRRRRHDAARALCRHPP